MNEPRRHHFVPISHLKRFTATGNEREKLFVVDKQLLTTWSAIPNNCAHEKDFYAVELESGERIQACERAIADAEAKLTPAVVRLIDERRWPSSVKAQADVLRFVALAHFRTPATLDRFTAFGNDQLLRECFEAIKCGKFDADYHRRHGRAPTQAERHDVLMTLVNKDIRITPNSAAWVELLLTAVNQIGPQLAFRKWDVLTANPNSPDFVCSDCPAVLTLREPAKHLPGFIPGISSAHTWLVLPLSRRLALIGSHENTHPRGSSNARQVGFLNRLVIEHASRFIYGSTCEIAWAYGRHMLGTSELLKFIRCGNPWS